MLDDLAEAIPEDQWAVATCSAGADAFSPMPSKDFIDMMKGTAPLIEAVVQINLRMVQALLRADNPESVLELQRQFVREYMAALSYGTMTLLGIGPVTAD